MASVGTRGSWERNRARYSEKRILGLRSQAIKKGQLCVSGRWPSRDQLLHIRLRRLFATYPSTLYSWTHATGESSHRCHNAIILSVNADICNTTGCVYTCMCVSWLERKGNWTGTASCLVLVMVFTDYYAQCHGIKRCFVSLYTRLYYIRMHKHTIIPIGSPKLTAIRCVHPSIREHCSGYVTDAMAPPLHCSDQTVLSTHIAPIIKPEGISAPNIICHSSDAGRRARNNPTCVC